MEHGSIRHGRVAVKCSAQQKGSGPTRDQNSLGPIPCLLCPGRCGGRALLLGSGRGGSCWQQCPPPPSSVEGLAGVGFGCPRSACPQGLVSWVTDLLRGQAGPQVVPTRVSLWLAQKDGCQQGHWPAWPRGGRDTLLLLLPPAPCTLHHRLVCVQRVLVPVTLFGPSWAKCPFPRLAPFQAGNCHRNQHIPAEMLQF